MPDGDLEAVIVRTAERGDARLADKIWSGQRPPGHTNLHWCWESFCDKYDERFVIIAADSVLALWTGLERPRLIEGRRTYRLERLEVAPSHRRTAVTAFALVTVSLRARELGCEAVVFSALPGTEKFYAAYGAEAISPKVWNDSSNLPAFIFRLGALRTLEELKNEFSNEED